MYDHVLCTFNSSNAWSWTKALCCLSFLLVLLLTLDKLVFVVNVSFVLKCIIMFLYMLFHRHNYAVAMTNTSLEHCICIYIDSCIDLVYCPSVCPERRRFLQRHLLFGGLSARGLWGYKGQRVSDTVCEAPWHQCVICDVWLYGYTLIDWLIKLNVLWTWSSRAGWWARPDESMTCPVPQLTVRSLSSPQTHWHNAAALRHMLICGDRDMWRIEIACLLRCWNKSKILQGLYFWHWL